MNCVPKQRAPLWQHYDNYLEATFMRSSAEFSIDLSTQELLESPAFGPVEVDDISSIVPLPGTAADIVAHDRSYSMQADSIEIELTAQQMDALLNGEWLP